MDNDFLPEQRFEIPLQIRFRDTDMMGHMNHAVFVTYLETARVAWLASLSEEHGLQRIPIIIAKVEVDYHYPLTIRDRPKVALWVSHIGKKSFTFEYSVYEEKDNEQITYATASTVIVYYNYQENRSEEIPETWLTILEKLHNNESLSTNFP